MKRLSFYSTSIRCLIPPQVLAGRYFSSATSGIDESERALRVKLKYRRNLFSLHIKFAQIYGNPTTLFTAVQIWQPAVENCSLNIFPAI
jgi:hypothetical protein